MLKTSDFDFYLPPQLIAQKPFFPKEQTKMLVFKDAAILDSNVSNLDNFLQAGDLLVFNDAHVIKAKLSATILRNLAVLDFNLDQENNGLWSALCRPAKKVKVKDELQIAADFSAEVCEKSDDGFIKIKFNCPPDQLPAKLEKYGSVPLPPYIKRRRKNIADQVNYQTIYARNAAETVAVAAPTAGLHFSNKIFSLLAAKKIQKVFLTLNVGAGTFLPVRSHFLKDHIMHSESFTISCQAAEIINQTKSCGKKIVAVGTTTMRVLESCCDAKGIVRTKKDNTAIFIYPPYKFRVADVLMTNFHLPKSTLFMLVCAFIGREKAFELYNHAIRQDYRFYSYGDACLLFSKN
jgi:S-adenosylmethionine:tRNA ribosyltransferase-isomerase